MLDENSCDSGISSSSSSTEEHKKRFDKYLEKVYETDLSSKKSKMIDVARYNELMKMLKGEQHNIEKSKSIIKRVVTSYWSWLIKK